MLSSLGSIVEQPSVIVAVLRVLGHRSANLLKRAPVEVHFFQELSIPIMESLDLPHDVVRHRASVLLIHILDIMNVVHIVHEPAHLLRNFTLSLPHEVDSLHDQLSYDLHVLVKAMETDFCCWSFHV